MTTAHPAYSKGEYTRNRKLLLATHPTCTIRAPGCTTVATTVDHVVALADGGDNSITNLRAACGPCNSHLGGRNGRAKQLRLSDSFSRRPNPTPSPDPQAISGRAGVVVGRYRRLVGDVPTLGRVAPRLSIGAVGDGSCGPEVAGWAARHLPFELMEWNQVAVDGLLTTVGGRWVHRQGLITVGRQNSKTTLATSLAGWWLDEYADRHGPQVVTWMAHDLRLAEIAFFTLSQMLDHRVVRTSSSYGRQRLHLDNGSQFHVQAATFGAGHGLSIDLAVVDEVWRVKPETVDHGLAPAQRARPQPLMLMLSTAGDEQSVLLKEWRERGMAMVETNSPGRLYFAEWSPPPGVDFTDPQWWP